MGNQLKVLHIGNTAGVSSKIQSSMRALGYKCNIMMFYPDVLNYGCDYLYPYSKWIRLNLPLYTALRINKLLKVQKDFDIFHFNNFGGITFQTEYPIWKFLKKGLVLHYHGTDIRRIGREWPMARFADIKYVSTPDLLQYAPTAKWVPNMICLDDFIYKPPQDHNGPIRILNALGSMFNAPKKGTQVIQDAIKSLKEWGYNIDFQFICGVDYKTALKYYSRVDIIIDQTHLGWYGNLALEGMSLGKPVVSYIDEEFIPSDIPTPPIINFEQDDPKSLAKSLIPLIEDINYRENLSLKGRKFVEDVHDSKKVIPGILKDYQEIKDKYD